jgi:tRNA threonylcarbamoyl adenosine modification protein (Sua5/YciO/YrdC/YwlC family)
MLLKIHPENPHSRNLKKVVECLQSGGVIICPTDTVYGIGCDIYNHDAVERVCRIKGIRPEESNFSFICHDFSHLSDFTKQIDNNVFRVMRKALPGPFTFILKANNNVPKLFKSKKKTVGIRIPDNSICRAIVQEFGHPIVTTSVHSEDKVISYITDPEIIYEKYWKVVDIVIDGGVGKNTHSTVINCADGNFTIIRQGLGKIEDFL